MLYLISLSFSLSARAGGRAEFIQPSLGPLQPNFEDFMDFDLGKSLLSDNYYFINIILLFSQIFLIL